MKIDNVVRFGAKFQPGGDENEYYYEDDSSTFLLPN